MDQEVISLFIGFVLHRQLSGIRNGVMYRPIVGNNTAFVALSGMLIIILPVCAILFGQAGWYFVHPYITESGIIGSVFLSAVASSMALNYEYKYFKHPLAKDLHLWTLLEQSLLATAFIFAGLIPTIIACLCVYPSLILQKAMINWLIGEAWDYEGTDDPKGEYYSLPSIGIKVPRINSKTRMALAIASIVILFVLTVL